MNCAPLRQVSLVVMNDMTDLNIHFSREEFAHRQYQVRESLEAQSLDGALLFKIEDMYWLTGYDSDGFS
ncbi:MAG: aminopeptidase P family N-terminal domain-containing protein, partial [Nitrospinaceae bacterium]|nr:aminopeptidase P family N-terminal domain-containing protein [Nitrospinaceae bacterium]